MTRVRTELSRVNRGSLVVAFQVFPSTLIQSAAEDDNLGTQEMLGLKMAPRCRLCSPEQTVGL